MRFLIFFFAFVACAAPESEPGQVPSPPMKSVFGQTAAGDTIHRFTLRNDRGMSADVMTYGAYLTAVRVPDSAGNTLNVVQGFDELAPYLEDQPFFGATVGRYANRIGGATFELNGTTYEVPDFDRGNNLHGGPDGFDKQIWDVVAFDEQSVTLRHVSPDGHQGFPGTVRTDVSYSLNDDNALAIQYQASTDRPTILNLTNHSYFNLKDGGKTNILDHVLQIDADRYTPVDSVLIPLGDHAPVAGTPFDFRMPKTVGRDFEQLSASNGYDHNFVLNDYRDGTTLRFAARLSDPATGRQMEVWTTEPGIQIFTANWQEVVAGSNPHGAIALETQKHPDSPNQPSYPSAVITPESSYASRTEYRFRW